MNLNTMEFNEEYNIAQSSANVKDYIFTLTQDSNHGESAAHKDSILFDLENEHAPPVAPDWFLDALDDIESGREVDLNTALNEPPPEE